MLFRSRRAFLGQLWYPVMVGTVGFGVMLVILFWVVPQMREMSESMGLGERLPWLTEHIGPLYTGLFLTGLLTLLADTGLDPGRELDVVRSLAPNVDGLVLCAPVAPTARLVTAAGGRPLVFVNPDLDAAPPTGPTPCW